MMTVRVLWKWLILFSVTKVLLVNAVIRIVVVARVVRIWVAADIILWQFERFADVVL